MPPTDTPHILATGSPDEVKAWLYDASVPAVKAALEAQPADERPNLAAGLAELERERGDAARSTLLAHLDDLAPSDVPQPADADADQDTQDAPEAAQDAPEPAQEAATPAADAQVPPAQPDVQGPADDVEEASDEPAPTEVVVDDDCLVNYGGQLLRLKAGETLHGNLARYCAATGAPVSAPADPAEEDE